MNFQEFLRWEHATTDVIDFKKIYVDIAGDLIAGLILSELIYWYLPSKNEEKNKLKVFHNNYWWIAIPSAEWWDRVRIHPKTASRRLQILKDAGLIETATFRFNGLVTTHIRILEENFLNALTNVLANPPENPYSKTVTEDCQSNVQFGQIVQTDSDNLSKSKRTNCPNPLTENTTETTAETTTSTDIKDVGDEYSKPVQPTSRFSSRTHRGKSSSPFNLTHQTVGEIEYVDPEDEFENRTRKLQSPKWKKATSELCIRAMRATGRIKCEFADKNERHRWVMIEKSMAPLDPQGRVIYPTEWVEEMIEWASNANNLYQRQTLSSAVKITFGNLINAIMNEGKRTDWISKRLKKGQFTASSDNDDDWIGGAIPEEVALKYGKNI